MIIAFISIYFLLNLLVFIFYFFTHNYADIIVMTHMFFEFCKTNLIIFRINQNNYNIPSNNIKIDFVKAKLNRLLPVGVNVRHKTITSIFFKL